ncbi:TetR/AcrR family transcriptional regulator [Nocardia vaccinii]|uniref:TetR/AcrR family transcriptional regulator n=1 Tax=Nocardia vaccinii TaxID=1822 RepID=UPI0008304C2E|nr:TetR/AcrR family transcriptional regulator [Nocardia vaccinii]
MTAQSTQIKKPTQPKNQRRWSMTKPRWYDAAGELVPHTKTGLEAKILDAARRCYVMYGPAKLTMGDVARAAGVSRASMYNYFADRETLLDAVRSWSMEVFTDDIRSAMSSEEDIADQLAAATVIVLRYEKWRHANVHPADIDIRFETGTFTTASSQAVSALMMTIEPFIAEGIVRGDVRPDLDPTDASECVARMLFSLFTTPGISFDSRKLKDSADFVRRAMGGMLTP